MKLFPVHIKRVFTTVISSATNWLAQVKPAIRVAARAALKMPAAMALHMAQAPSILKMSVKPALRLGLAPLSASATQKPVAKLVGRGVFLIPEREAARLVSTGNLTMMEKPALRLAMSPSSGVASEKAAPKLVSRVDVTTNEKAAPKLIMAPATMKSPEKPAVNITQARFDLEHKSFVVTMTNDVANTRNWTSPANAQGANDAVLSTWDGTLALAQTGAMHGTLVAQNNRPASLAIDSVWLALWGDWAGLPVVDDLLSGLEVGFTLGTPAVDTRVIRRGVSSGTDTGTEVRIDDGAGKFIDVLGTAVSWANLAALQFFAKGITLVGVAATFHVDAIRLRVVAHEVWSL